MRFSDSGAGVKDFVIFSMSLRDSSNGFSSVVNPVLIKLFLLFLLSTLLCISCNLSLQFCLIFRPLMYLSS